MENRIRIAICAALGSIVTSACSRPPAAAAMATPVANSSTTVTTSRPTSVPAERSDADTTTASASQTISARVLETMDASNYTYVRVNDGARDIWAAASRFKVAVGDTVVLALDHPLQNFHSQALNRDFPEIYFVSQLGSSASAAPTMAVGHGAAQTTAPAGRQTPTSPIAATKDGLSVADVWKSRAALEGRKVTIRGKVVKFNSGILGVNWIHLQDGSGKADDGTNDITVTSDMEAKVGDLITVTGVVTLNKDLGSGYKYAVIIERASIHRALNADR